MEPAAAADFDIVIVGLGPVGAVAANLAGLAGFRTLVLERGDQPYLKPRAIVFDAEIMRIFDSIGLASRIAQSSRALEGSVYLGADRRPIRTFRARPPAHPLAWHPSNLFYQPQLEQILRDGLGRFSNVSVWREHEVTGVRQSDGRCVFGVVSSRQRISTEVSGRFALACDGASSTIRKSLGITLDDIGFEERWLVLDALLDGPMRWPATHEIGDEVRSGRYSLMVCDPARPATLIPGVGRHRRWEYMLLPGESDQRVSTEAWQREQLAQWVDPAQVEIIRSAVYRFRALIARQWRVDRVFLVGDAAHQTPPFYGQGMCHGIRDAAQLMWRLQLLMDGVAPPILLDSYQVERQPHVREIISASVAAGAQVCKLDPLEAARRDAEFRRIEAERHDGPLAMTDVVPPIRAGVIDTVSGGARLPEFACLTVEGSLQRLDRLLDGHFTLVSLAGAGSDTDDSGDGLPPQLVACWRRIGGRDLRLAIMGDAQSAPLRDHDGRFGQWLEQQQARWVIVRPDRYVYATAADRIVLQALLERLFEQLGCTGYESEVAAVPEHESASSIHRVSLS